jgi:hypothetical protein
MSSGQCSLRPCKSCLQRAILQPGFLELAPLGCRASNTARIASARIASARTACARTACARTASSRTACTRTAAAVPDQSRRAAPLSANGAPLLGTAIITNGRPPARLRVMWRQWLRGWQQLLCIGNNGVRPRICGRQALTYRRRGAGIATGGGGRRTSLRWRPSMRTSRFATVRSQTDLVLVAGSSRWREATEAKTGTCKARWRGRGTGRCRWQGEGSHGVGEALAPTRPKLSTSADPDGAQMHPLAAYASTLAGCSRHRRA